MNDTVALGSVSIDGWDIQFNSPVQFETHKEWDEEAECYCIAAYVDCYKRESGVIGSTMGDLIDEFIPASLIGLLMHPPCEDPTCPNETQEYIEYYNYIKNSIDTIQFRLPGSMQIEGTHETSIKVEFI